MTGLLPLRPTPYASWAIDLSVFGLFSVGLVLLGRHVGFVDDEASLAAIAAALLFGLAGLVLALVALGHIWASGRPGTARSIVAVLIGLPVFVLLAFSTYGLMAYPRVNDVTTDAADPPRFWSTDHPHPDRLKGAAAEAARGSYADLASRAYHLDAEHAFAIARTLVEERGWQANLFVPPDDGQGTGRIEATARTLLFRFPDDIAIRIVGSENGSRVDLRSVSRYGVADLGANARRVRAFLRDFDAAVAEAPGLEDGEEPAAEGVPSG